MEPTATRLARSFVVAWRARATGTFRIGGDASLTVHVRDGLATSIVAAARDGYRLGDLLDRALPTSPSCRVGSGAVRAGFASAAAVQHALRRQAKLRIARSILSPTTELRFAEAPVDGLDQVDAQLPALVLALMSARVAAPTTPLPVLRSTLRLGPLDFAAVNADDLDLVPRSPVEHAIGALVRRGLNADALWRALGARVDVLRTLHAWVEMGLVSERGAARRAHTELARAATYLRRTSRRPTAADLGVVGSRERRDWLRRVHPDRFEVFARAAVIERATVICRALSR